jgi:hypothetical protein
MPWAVFVSTGNGLCAAITLAKILHAMTAGRTLKYAVLLMFWIVPASVAYAATSPSPSHCVFHRVDDHFGGSCGALFDQTPAMTLSPATGITTGVWRDDLHPASVWAGDMTDQGYPNAPLELEIYTGGWGVLRTVYGWFAVTQFAVSSTLSFDLDASREVNPNALDQKIVRQAAAILSTEAAWNRADNRKCPANATTWSIYCALEKATFDVTGGIHHRRPAAEVVREIVEQRTAARNYHHHLMEYNNDPTTHLDDVQSLFQEALNRIEEAINPSSNSEAGVEPIVAALRTR